MNETNKSYDVYNSILSVCSPDFQLTTNFTSDFSEAHIGQFKLASLSHTLLANKPKGRSETNP
jgi:hypothetical protein